jgi:hypothetical protein
MKSNIAEKLINICQAENNFGVEGYGIDNLTARQLKEVEAILIKHLEFDRIEWVDLPGVPSPAGGAKVCKTMKLADDNMTTHKGKIGYVYKVMFSPTICDPTEYTKHKSSISPTVYDTVTFEPKRYITLSFSPSQNTGTLETDVKMQLRDQLDDVLRDPEKYHLTGYRAAMIRFFAE